MTLSNFAFYTLALAIVFMAMTAALPYEQNADWVRLDAYFLEVTQYRHLIKIVNQLVNFLVYKAENDVHSSLNVQINNYGSSKT